MNMNFEAKDETRIADILRKSDTRFGRVPGKAEQLAARMAKQITKADKALRRARAAEDVNEHGLAEIFLTRYRELSGQTVSIAKTESEPEMVVKIVGVKFVTKESLSARPVVYFWKRNTTDLLDMVEQRRTPMSVFKPFLDEVLRPVGFTVDEQRTSKRRMLVRASWSKHAGCKMCPCSPGFVLSGTTADDTDTVRQYEFDIHIDYDLVVKK